MPPDRWMEVTVRTSLDAGLVASVLFEMGASGVEERGPDLVTYLPPAADPLVAVDGIREALLALGPSEDPELSWRWQPQKAWEVLWRRGLGSRKISPRITVTPSWETVEKVPGEHVVVLDPGMAFGTAEHATTRSCIRALDGLVSPGEEIVDVGSGSGILAIAAVLLGAGRVLAIEVDTMSCETALENMVRNGVDASIRVLEAEVRGDEPLPESPCDGILANLQSHLILPLLNAFAGSLRPGGWLVVSGILSEQAEGVETAASECGFQVEATEEEDGWWTATFRR